MNKDKEWNRREFIVKPIVWAGAAGVLSKTQSLFATTDAAGPILQRTLGKTGITLPVVSMGVMNADVPGLLRRAYAFGIRHFDTAAVYQQGRNEEMVGRVIKEMGVREKVIISTKQHMRNRPPSVAEAKRRFTVEDHIRMTEGVECRKDVDVIDETPAAYKPIDAVMAAQADLVEIVHTLRQVVCVKG